MKYSIDISNKCFNNHILGDLINSFWKFNDNNKQSFYTKKEIYKANSEYIKTLELLIEYYYEVGVFTFKTEEDMILFKLK
jgi:hypothetical protein